MKIASIFAFLLCAGLLVACSGSEPAPPTDTPTEDQPTTETATPPAKEPSKTDDAKSELSAAFGARVEYKAEYDLSVLAQGKTVTSTLTQYIKVAGSDSYKMRMDATYEGIQTQTYIVDETYTTCTKLSGKWSCFTPQSEEKTMQDNVKDDLAKDSSKVVRDGTMKIAGVTADCYLVTSTQGSSRYCIYKTVPLYVKTMDEKGVMISEMKATSFEERVADSDFTPPAKPSSDPMAGLGGTFPAGMEIPEGYDLPSS